MEGYGMNMTEEAYKQMRDEAVYEYKARRKGLDEILQRLRTAKMAGRPSSIAITKLQECIMWLDMQLKELGESTPYPNSYNPENAIVEPTADGLKL